VPERAKATPKNLSTEDSPLRINPMWMDFDDHGFSGMTPYRGENTFASTTESFIPLVDREYDLIGSADRTFTKFVSRSMWTYYCVEHLYARCIAVLRHRGCTTHAEEEFAESIRSGNYPVPSCIEEFLRSLGDLTDVTGKKHTFEVPAWPNDGHFEQVTGQDHWMYEAMTAPIVLGCRIRAHLQKTLNPAVHADWDLPIQLRPIEAACGLPTANLLGWARATTLTSEQLRCNSG
jgi:hypothetical protein